MRWPGSAWSGSRTSARPSRATRPGSRSSPSSRPRRTRRSSTRSRMSAFVGTPLEFALRDCRMSAHSRSSASPGGRASSRPSGTPPTGPHPRPGHRRLRRPATRPPPSAPGGPGHRRRRDHHRHRAIYPLLNSAGAGGGRGHEGHRRDHARGPPRGRDTTPARRPRVLMVVANPSVSTTTGWPVGFWAAELFHPLHEFTKVRYRGRPSPPPRAAGSRSTPSSDPRDESRWSADDVISMGSLHTPEIAGRARAARPSPAQTSTSTRTTRWSSAAARGRCSSSATTMTCSAPSPRFFEAEKPTAALCHGVSRADRRRRSRTARTWCRARTITGFANIEEDFSDAAVGQLAALVTGSVVFALGLRSGVHAGGRPDGWGRAAESAPVGPRASRGDELRVGGALGSRCSAPWARPSTAARSGRGPGGRPTRGCAGRARHARRRGGRRRRAPGPIGRRAGRRGPRGVHAGTAAGRRSQRRGRDRRGRPRRGAAPARADGFGARGGPRPRVRTSAGERLPAVLSRCDRESR